ncbi:MAG: hypothetical protein ACREQ5_21650 [Candidatus Dormibacteria bacterium]
MAGNRPPRALAIALAVVVVALTFVAYEKYLARATPPPGVTLTDLRSVDQLQSLFDADTGSTRLVLVLSPT